jgi:hypothetical protein
VIGGQAASAADFCGLGSLTKVLCAIRVAYNNLLELFPATAPMAIPSAPLMDAGRPFLCGSLRSAELCELWL